MFTLTGLETTLHTRHGYEVEVRSDDKTFTVYKNDKPVATLNRPNKANPEWTGWHTNGALIGKGIGPRTTLRQIVAYLRTEA
jgi:hypothetical protein